MAEKASPIFFFLSFVFLLFSSVICRTHPNIPKTIMLDVSASLQRTQDAISLDAQTQQQETQSLIPDTTTASSPSSFTLQLHSRDSIKHPTTHKDYRSLTLARLARDSARVKSLTTKLEIAVNGVDRNDLKPQDSSESVIESEGKGLAGPIVSGTSQGSGEYFSRVGIGRPPKPLYMVLDTGSDITWVQCQPCTDCYQQADPVFQPSSSSTFSSLSCESQPCKSLDVSACRNDTCLYQVSYGDGSYTVGDFVTETLTFGDSASVSNIALGCGHDNEGLFVGAAGLLGLGGGSLSFPSQVSASSFSYCLVDRDSTSTSTLQFGPDGTNSVVTAPLLRNQKLATFYYVGLTGMSVGGEILSIPPSSFGMDESGDGGVILDSGTAITRLQSDAYNSLRDAFAKGTRDLPSTSGVALFDTCYDLSSRSSVEVPTIAFHFAGGKSLPLPAKNYLIPVDSTGTFCLAFAPTSSSLSIIGNVQQQGTRVSFDLDKTVVGFAPNKC
ncbi:protein ASPARTIC PROTEASE IN GUARD CELL 1-like [Magnolia sinica]|uniref:protein ASPARTIC PROTEASE IN GUARD CELL 1-like n=1 Tax=Magnolia sinica TaxID=86752 RepID=UPI0026581B8D|nr:protein ASPARTIC PROTEASE IN GUARD CELL 1-like [Magnolia sinica]